MPQVTIEYSANAASAFDPQTYALRVHDLLVEHVETELASCKTRLVQHDRTVIGDGASANAMIHVDLRILTGRTGEQKKQLGQAAFAALEAAVTKPDGLELQLTLEVRDLDRENYHKRRL